jgi:penicillin-binding protein 1A
VEIWTRFMKAAHQGITPAPIPGAAPSSFFASVAQAVTQVVPGTPPRQLAPAEQQSAPPRGYVPSAPVYNGNRPQPAAPTQANYPAARSPPSQNVRPEAASGLDGWLTERLFGR